MQTCLHVVSSKCGVPLRALSNSECAASRCGGALRLICCPGVCSQRWTVNRKCLTRLLSRLSAHGCMHVVVVSNRHLSRNVSNSCIFLDIVVRFLQEHGVTISMRLGKLPDADVRFMALSRVFIKSRGAFSGTVATLVKLSNGTIISMQKNGLAGIVFSERRNSLWC